jgi:4-amino-4-deoxy-L-arabinose transferase-like glycosyltransferase
MIFAVPALYFGIHVVVRTLVSDSLQVDEAEQILMARDWRLGYGSQPPLYTWLQRAFFRVFGPGVFALALLKNLLLWGVFALIHQAARRVFADRLAPVLAAGSLVLFPGLMWESQRDQTHLVLATCLSAALLLSWLRLWQSPTPGAYALLGAVAGLGVLAKYNYAVLLAALLGTAVATRATRPLVLRPRMLIAVGVFLMVTGAHAWWCLRHPDIALAQTHKFKLAAGGWLGALAMGLREFFLCVLAYAGPPLALVGILFAGARPAAGPAAGSDRPELRFLGRTMLAGLGLSLAGILAFQVTSVKARWFQPLFMFLPLVLAAWMAPRVTPARIRALGLLITAALITVPVILYGRVTHVAWSERPTNLNHPYGAWAAELRRAGFTEGWILTPNLGLGGNLQYQIPGATVGTPELSPGHPPPGAKVLVAWRPAGRNGAMTNAFDFCERLTGRRPDPASARGIEAPMVHHPANRVALGYAILDPLSAP